MKPTTLFPSTLWSLFTSFVWLVGLPLCFVAIKYYISISLFSSQIHNAGDRNNNSMRENHSNVRTPLQSLAFIPLSFSRWTNEELPLCIEKYHLSNGMFSISRSTTHILGAKEEKKSFFEWKPSSAKGKERMKSV